MIGAWLCDGVVLGSCSGSLFGSVSPTGNQEPNAEREHELRSQNWEP